MAVSPAGNESDGTASIRSPGMPRPSRLVARMWTASHFARIASDRSAVAAIKCSQLSSTNRRRRSARYSTNASRGGRCEFKTPKVAATASSTRVASASGARSTHHTPSRKADCDCSAIRRANRVFPLPPTPLKVTSLLVSSSRANLADSSTRPMKDVRAAERLPTGRVLFGVRE